MNLPAGRLLRRRVLKNIETVLTGALEREITGYARLEPQSTLLLDTQGVGVLTFEDGVPVAAYYTATDTAGPEALTEIASSGPYRLELYELDESDIAQVHESASLLVEPTLPAQRLTGNTRLVNRTRSQAPEERLDTETLDDSGLTAVEDFLDDGEAIETIQKRARTEARSRADDWDLPVENRRP